MCPLSWVLNCSFLSSLRDLRGAVLNNLDSVGTGRMQDDNPDLRRAGDLLDQSKPLRKRARRRVSDSKQRIERARHQWHRLPVGRVCLVCQKVQATDEFDDAVPCKAS
jgi:hypothetical protein